MAFDPVFARDVALPLSRAAYAATGSGTGGTVALPSGFTQTALIQVGAAAVAAMTSPHPAVAAMTKNTNVFGLMGRNANTAMAFISFRGTQDLSDWLEDLDAATENYAPINGFGQVHDGFQDVYELCRASIAANLATACAGCDQILITGHSLGAALAVLAAPDVFRKMPPNTIEPRLITFAGPRVGLSDFATAFNTEIESCFRVVNFLDIVPHVPPSPPFADVGAQIAVDSGGSIDPTWRHDLDAYQAGLTALITAQQ
jgi:triacylglycerol lipase